MKKSLILIATCCPALVLADAVPSIPGLLTPGQLAKAPAAPVSELDQILLDLTDVLNAMEQAAKLNDAEGVDAQLEKAIALTTEIKLTDAAERQACTKAQGKALQGMVSSAFKLEKAVAGKPELRAKTAPVIQAIVDSFK